MEGNGGLYGVSPILSLLHERERKGIKNGNRELFFDKLSSCAAWNRSRIRDMALVVGPSTPAASESSTATSLQRASTSATQQQQEQGDETDEDMVTEDDSSTFFNQHQKKQNNKGLRPAMRSSMKHRGCINTASWLTAGWKLSFSKNSLNSQDDDIFKSVGAHLTEECTTQLMTSGDDRTVMFWDVSGAMGSTSLPEYPHPTTRPAFSYMEDKDDDETSDFIISSQDLSGSVTPLGMLPTSHRGNIFHVAPVPYQPGLISTCAADGSLQLGDVERSLGPSASASSSSSASQAYTTIVVTSPEFAGSSEEQHSLFEWLHRSNSSMAFTHCFLNRHIGLLCSERGLHKFDLRLSPREQPRQNLFVLPQNNDVDFKMSCKACALWNQHNHRQQSLEDQETWYAFAGGTSGVVGLYDLRMDGGGSGAASTKTLQTYLPSTLGNSAWNTIANTSVSGIGVSKDGTELLVSYDSDQIYTFDVVPKQQPIKEKAMYGGHLNRCTFLKEAKYAGPRDEYICTGSDSGHAWIYDRDSGSVAALLKADRSTCNGVIPHPTLPFFITYGIDSTAKLWRAISNPNSPCTASRPLTYNKSALVCRWKEAQRRLSLLPELEEDGIPVGCLPNSLDCGSRDDDESSEADDSYFLPFIRRSVDRNSRQHDLLSGTIGNSLKALPELLQLNYDTCFREVAAEKADTSVHSGLHALARNVSVSRLRHQADRLGLRWNKEGAPWILDFKKRPIQSSAFFPPGPIDLLQHPADLIPDFPMDWMPYDVELTDEPKRFWSRNGNASERTSNDNSSSDELCAVICEKPWLSLYNNSPSVKGTKGGSDPTDQNVVPPRDKPLNAQSLESSVEDTSIATAHRHSYSEEHALEILLKTISILKDGGNTAMEAGFSVVAAQRYDKAISYCSLVFLTFHVGNLKFLEVQHSTLLKHKGIPLQWTALLKLMITIRLNLSMAMQKPELADWDGAVDQARLALQELKPFTISPGRAISGKIGSGEEVGAAETVYQEAKELQAKAYFRLGTAQYSAKNYSGAVCSFEKSIQSMKESKPGVKPDAMVLRRLAEARRDKAKKQERVRKKFKNSIQEDAT